MTTTAVVKHFDVLEQIRNGLLTRAINLVVDALIVQRVEEALRGRVVPAIALATHRAHYAIVVKLALKRLTGILAAAIGVMNQPRLRTPSQPRHTQRVDDDVGAHG